MNRNHFTILTAIILAVSIITCGVTAYQIREYRNEIAGIREAVELSTYSATVELKKVQGGTSQLADVIQEYFNLQSRMLHKEVEELYLYTPVFIIMQEAGFYVCTYVNGYKAPKPEDIHRYTSNGVTATLSGNEVTAMGITLSSRVTEEELRDCVQLSVEHAINDAMAQYQLVMARDDYQMDLDMNISIEPNPSIIAVFQNYPLPINNARYDYIYQSARQIWKR